MSIERKNVVQRFVSGESLVLSLEICGLGSASLSSSLGVTIHCIAGTVQAK